MPVPVVNVASLLVRPDFYIFGSAQGVDGVRGLVADLHNLLRIAAKL